MKAGTTTVHEHMAAQPGVAMCRGKETDFFSLDERWARGLGWYRAQFDGTRDPENEGVRGECCPSYAMVDRYPGTAERLAAVAPGTVVVYLVRDPLARMLSMYRHHVFRGEERRPARAALLGDPRYLAASSYARHLAWYGDWFPRERIHVFATEELARDPAGTWAALGRAVGVALPPGGAARRAHPSAGKREPRRALAAAGRRGNRGFVDRPVLALDRLPAWAQPVVGQPFPPDGALLAPADGRELQARLAPDVAALRDWVGAGRFDAWGWGERDPG
jgi:hypothetical protein